MVGRNQYRRSIRQSNPKVTFFKVFLSRREISLPSTQKAELPSQSAAVLAVQCCRVRWEQLWRGLGTQPTAAVLLIALSGMHPVVMQP